MNTNASKAIPSEEDSSWTYPETQDFSFEAERGMEKLLQQIQGFVHMLTTNEKLDTPQVNGPLSRPLMFTNELLKMARNQLAVEVSMRTPPESPTDVKNMTSEQANIHQRELDRMHKVMKVKMDLTSMMQTIDAHVHKEGALKDAALEGSRGESSESDGAAVCRDGAVKHRSAVRFAECDGDDTGSHFRDSRCSVVKTNQKNKCSVRTPSMVKQRVRQFEDGRCKLALGEDIADEDDAGNRTPQKKVAADNKKKDVELDFEVIDLTRSSTSLLTCETPIVAKSVSQGDTKRVAKKRGRKGSKKRAMKSTSTSIDTCVTDLFAPVTRDAADVSEKSGGSCKSVSVKCDSTKCDSTKCDSAKCDSAKCDSKTCASTKCDSTKSDSRKCDSTKCDSKKRDSAKCCKRKSTATTGTVTTNCPATCDAETGEAHTCNTTCYSTCGSTCDSKCDSKCGSKYDSSATENYEINTTKKDESENDPEVSGQPNADADVERDLSLMTPVAVLGYHLLKTGITASYKLLQRDLLKEPPFVATYNYACSVLSLLVTAEGRSKPVAMQEAAAAMLALFVEQQQNNTLHSHIMHLTWKELAQLKPMLEKGVRPNAMNDLRRECRNKGHKVPTFKLLSTEEQPSGKRLITVTCSALGVVAIGCGHNKRNARLDAATNILRHHHEPRHPRF